MMRQMRRDRTKHQDGYGQILKVLLLTIAPILFSTAIYNINQIIDLTLFAKIMAAQGVTLKEYIIHREFTQEIQYVDQHPTCDGERTCSICYSGTDSGSCLQKPDADAE